MNKEYIDGIIGVAVTIVVSLVGAASLKYLLVGEHEKPPVIVNTSTQTCTTFLWGGCQTSNGAK